MAIAGAAGEFYPIEELEHLDGHVAADSRPVAERSSGNRTARLRLLARHLLKPADRGWQKETAFRYPHREPVARKP